MTESAGTVDVREAFTAEPLPALVPGRLRKPLVHVQDDAAPKELIRDIGAWLFQRRDLARHAGDRSGEHCFAWEIVGLESLAPELAARVRALIVEGLTPEALEALAVPEFDLGQVEVVPVLMHHGGHFGWHDDWIGPDGQPATTRRVAFDLFLHTEPKRFTGGALDFPSGDSIEPTSGRLVFRHPLQMHRITPVECWAAEHLHGRWALTGWIHGTPPDGWVERVQRLRCAPEA